MQQNVGELHVAMDDIQGPDILDALHNLLDDDTRLFLADVTAGFQEDAKIESIGVLLHHVNVGSCLDGLVESDGVRRAHHAVNFDLLVDAIKIFLGDV